MRYASRASRSGVFGLGVALLAAPAFAIDYKSVDAPAAIMYETPAPKAKKLWLLKKTTPVEVLVVVDNWSKVREPDGAIGWVEKKHLSDKRTVIVTAAKAQIRQTADANGSVVFEADKGVSIEVADPVREGWIKVRHTDGQSGFVRITQVWGY